MEKIFEQAMLYDFYGELLNDHQKSIFEEYVLDNLSLAEIAQEHNISRQGVHDIIKRADKALNEYEDKLHLVRRFVSIKNKISHISNVAQTFGDNENAIKITSICDEIIDEL